MVGRLPSHRSYWAWPPSSDTDVTDTDSDVSDADDDVTNGDVTGNVGDVTNFEAHVPGAPSNTNGGETALDVEVLS